MASGQLPYPKEDAVNLRMLPYQSKLGFKRGQKSLKIKNKGLPHGVRPVPPPPKEVGGDLLEQ